MSAPPVLSVIAPCYNEEGNVGELVRRTLAMFDAANIEGELILVDDGSKDATWQRITEAMQTQERVVGVAHALNKGIEGGWHSGLEAARGKWVCLIDSDLQNRPEDVARLYEAYRREQPDMVQAVRNPKNVHTRRIFSRALNHLLNVTFDMDLRDNKSGFILCGRDLMRELLAHRYAYRYFQSFIGAAAGVRGLRITEVDTDFEPRQVGVSFLSDFPLKVSLRIVRELLMFRWETRNVRNKRS